MLADPKALIQDAKKNHYAIVGINVPSLPACMAAIDAAEQLKCPVMLSHAQLHDEVDKAAPIEVMGAMMKYFAEKAKVPVIIHLDHGLTKTYITRAIRSGFTSIMYDCSLLDDETNMREVSEFTTLAHELGIIVEAEVGKMPSNVVGHGGCTEYGQKIENISDYFTKPEQAAEFVEKTNVDMLTVSFGTVHGIFVEEPKLDIELLKKISAATDCPLVMHGSSGVKEAELIAAIENGVAKYNFYTAMGTSCGAPIANAIASSERALYIHELERIAYEAMLPKALHALELGINGKAAAIKGW